MPVFFRSSARVHWLLIAAGLFAPALLFAGAAWKSRADVLWEGEAMRLNAVAVLGDAIRDKLQTEELALAAVSDHLRNLDWHAITRPETSDFLVKLKDPLDQISAITIADRDGTVRASSQIQAQSSRIAEREFFQIDRHGERYISVMFAGPSMQPISLTMIRRRITPSGEFDGTIQAELDPGSLARLFTEVVPIAHDVILADAGGQVLEEADHQNALQRLGTDQSLMRTIIAQSRPGVWSGPLLLGGQSEELFSYEQVPGYPIWVGLAVDRAVLLSRWYGSLTAYAVAAAAGSLALLVAAWVAIRRAQAEQTAFTLLHAETERRLHAEQRMREVHRLEAVGQLAGGIAHDFNNLLAVVVGSLDLIGRTAGLNDRVQALVVQANRAAQRGARLTASLLAFARRQVMQTDALDVARLIREFLPVIEQTMGETVRLEVRLHPVLSPCRADAAQLEAALLNVVINARDAMPEGGMLTIATRNVELDRDELLNNPEAKPGVFVAVSLTDTGSGMSPEVAAKAFEPFFTTREIGQGSGLGLSHVLGFVRQLGGHVRIDSTPGRGSVVTLFLPQA
jgi:signal transduction histidine kinase